MTSERHSPDSELRILHWNVHSWRDDAGASNTEAVADLVRATDPHVVSLVEVDESWDGPSALDELAARTGYVSIFVPTFEFGTDAPAGGFGNALLSKLPILAVRQRQLVWPLRLYNGTEPSESRSVVFAKLQTPTGPVWIGSTHLPRGEEDMRVAALHRLTEITRGLTDPWLLVGDFNAPASSWLGEQSPLRARPWSTPTYPAKAPVEPIDYCVAPEASRVHADVLPEAGSDHLPILVRCWLRQPVG
jgi:endonuclease/exonuclease/phosphatase family metal-dependent hydrolase